MATAPARCAVVEDSVHGVVAALAAGMTPLAFAGSVTPAERLGAVDGDVVVFDSMAQLPALVGARPR